MSQNQDHIELMDSYRSPSASYEDGNLTIVRYELLTRKALKALDKEDALVIVPVGPIEVALQRIGTPYILPSYVIHFCSEIIPTMDFFNFSSVSRRIYVLREWMKSKISERTKFKNYL